MPKKYKDSISYDSFCAVFESSYVSLSQEPLTENQFEQLREKNSALDLLIRKELVSNLSKDAKEVVLTILDAPMNILEVLSPANYKRPTRNMLRKYLFQSGWEHKKIDAVFIELKEYSGQLNF